MKIGIDVSQIVYGTGVSVYTRNLLKTLLAIDKNNEYILFGGSLRQKNKLRADFNPKIFPIPPVLADLIWNRLHILPIENLIGKLDVFHSSDWSQPPSTAYKITTIHDLALFVDSSFSSSRIIAAHKRRLAWVTKEVNKIIAVSEATKKDIIKYLGIPKEKIAVIYEAPDPLYSKQGEDEVKKVLKKFQIHGDYVLSVGTGKRKNLNRIAKAIPKEYSHIIVGSDNVRPSDSELAALYSGAKVLVYASLYEGFGLPILEAFACECPVVTSNVSSMPEVAGNGAVLVNPGSTESITKGIMEAIRDRDRLVNMGIKRVKEFSWEKTARETIKVYEEAK